MRTCVVTLTEDGRWHCFDVTGDIPMYHLVGGNYYEKEASRFVRDIARRPSRPWDTEKDRNIFACACHARGRYQAIKMAKKYYNNHLLNRG